MLTYPGLLLPAAPGVAYPAPQGLGAAPQAPAAGPGARSRGGAHRYHTALTRAVVSVKHDGAPQ